MTWLTIMGYPCHKWPRIWSFCRNYNPVLSLFIAYYWACNKSNTTGATSRAGTAYSSGVHEFAPVFLHVLVVFVLFILSNKCLHAFNSVLWCLQLFLCKNYVDSYIRVFCFIYIICIYLRIVVSNTISTSDDVRVV